MLLIITRIIVYVRFIYRIVAGQCGYMLSFPCLHNVLLKGNGIRYDFLHIRIADELHFHHAFCILGRNIEKQ